MKSRILKKLLLSKFLIPIFCFAQTQEKIIEVKLPENVLEKVNSLSLEAVKIESNGIKLKCPENSIQIDSLVWGQRYSECCKIPSEIPEQWPKDRSPFGLVNKNRSDFKCDLNGPQLTFLYDASKLVSYSEYTDNKLNGKFILIYQNGEIHSGIYKEGKKHGVWADGPRSKINFENGHLKWMEVCWEASCDKTEFSKFDESSNVYEFGGVKNLVGNTHSSLGPNIYAPPEIIFYKSNDGDFEPLGILGNGKSHFPDFPEKCTISPKFWEPSGNKESFEDGVDLAVFDFQLSKEGGGYCNINISSGCNIYGWVKCVKSDAESYIKDLKEGLNLDEDMWSEVYSEIGGEVIDLQKKYGKEINDWLFKLEESKLVGKDMWGKFRLEPRYIPDRSGIVIEKGEFYWIKLHNNSGLPKFTVFGC